MGIFRGKGRLGAPTVQARVSVGVALAGVAALVLGGATSAMAAPLELTVCASACDHTTIQGAIDAATVGSTIEVGPGIYAEELVFDTAEHEGVTLLGAGQQHTFIVPARAYASDNRAISLYDVDGLTFEGFTIDGDGNSALEPGQHFHDGIWWNGGGDSVAIRNVTLRNIDRRAISVFPQQVTGTYIGGVTVDTVTGVNSGTSSGGYALMLNGSGWVENNTFTNVKAGVGGESRAPEGVETVFSGNTISELTGIDGGSFNIGINYWAANRNPVTVTGNTITGDAPRNSGIYLVNPGAGSVISGNTISLAGDGGIGIQTGWTTTAGPEIADNIVTMGAGATGIVVTGQGSAETPVSIIDNVLRNSSSEGPQTPVNYVGVLDDREVAILVSADPQSSRTGDANASTFASITDNDIAGYSIGLAYLQDSQATRTLTVATTGNTVRATSTAAVNVVDDGASPVPVADDSATYPAVDVSGNYWGAGVSGSALDALLEGAFTVTSVIDTPTPAVPDSESLVDALDALGVDPDGGLELFENPSVSLNSIDPAQPFSGDLEWAGADDSVDIWAYSEPVFLGSRPVVGGVAQIDALDLSDLRGDHRLIFIGSQTGTIVALPISVDGTLERIAGDDRFETAVEISRQAFPDAGVPVVFIAAGHDFPDALSAGPVAARLGGPLLLTESNSLPAVVRAELDRLEPELIVIIGGTSSISSSVAQALVPYAPSAGDVERIGGADRYETSRLVVDFGFGDSGADEVYVAAGENFPDALAAGAAAGASDAPVLLVRGSASSIDAATRAFVDELGAESIYLIGGTSAVRSGVASGLASIDSVSTVERLAGADRFETAVAVNQHAFATAGRVFLAAGYSFPDALSGGVLAAVEGGPLYTVQRTCVPESVLDELERLGATDVRLLGGTAVLTSRVANLRPCS